MLRVLYYHISWWKRKRQMMLSGILWWSSSNDTPFAKSGKKTELVSKFFNHVTMKYERGFRILTLLWSDEVTEISFTRSLALILEALLDTVKEFFAISDERMEAFTQSFLYRLPQHICTALGVSKPLKAA